MSGGQAEFRSRCSISRLVKLAGRAPRSEFRSLQARSILNRNELRMTIPHLDANRTQIQSVPLQLNAAITEAKNAAPQCGPR